MSGLTRPAADAHVTDAIVEFAVELTIDRLPPGALERAEKAFLDTVGVMIAGARAAPTRLRQTLRAIGQLEGSSTVAATSATAGLLDAIGCNGTAAHALDYDDTLQDLTTHPSNHLVPALLGLAEHEPASGPQVLLAYLVGLEVEARLSRAVNPDHRVSGWHSTGTLGTVATAVAAAKLLQLDADETRTAVGVSCSFASGIRANFGTMVKCIHAGRAARGGAEAALLARHGYDASPVSFQHRSGLFKAMNARSGADARDLWDAADMARCPSTDQLTVKPYPCCGEATAAVEAALTVRSEIEPAAVRSIDVRMGPFARGTLQFDRPRTPDEARFSAPYCVSAALIHGELAIAHFTDDAILDPDVGQMMERITVEVRDDFASTPTCEISVHTGSGADHVVRVDVPKGNASVGWPMEDARWKFRSCSEASLGADATTALLDRLSDLAASDDARDLLRLTAPSEGTSVDG